jgi:ABC-type branched-subunit amino acid transport system ATPase component
MTILSLKNFKKHFNGTKAVNGVSFEIEKGKITGLIGPNGSGKSTLINLVTGVVPKDKGVLIISDDVKIEKIRPFDMDTFGITRTFQNVQVFEQMTVKDNLLLTLTKRNVWESLFEKYSEIYEDRANDILKLIGLSEKKNELAQNLSYGQRKLLEIGRAIAMDCDVILFDEPYAGLFPEMVKKVSEIIKHFRDQDKAIMLVEHNMDLIRELCDHLVVMDAGEVLAEGEPLKILSLTNYTIYKNVFCEN